MADKVLHTESFEKALEAIEKIPERASLILEETMEEILMIVENPLREYPPATEANQPGRFSIKTGKPMGYYERGRGWWYPVMREKTIPAIRGKGVGGLVATKTIQTLTGVAGYKLIHSSEQLGKKWTHAVNVRDGIIEGVIGTTVSYADFVEGRHQAGFHAARGWPTADGVLEDKSDEIDAELDKGVEKILDELARLSA